MNRVARSLVLVASLMLFVLVPATHAVNHIPKKVNMRNTLFSKQALTIKENQRVQWVNKDAFEHRPVSCAMVDGTVCNNEGAEFDAGIIAAAGSSASFQFNAANGRPPGVYAYHCSIHPGMVGVIIVNPAN